MIRRRLNRAQFSLTIAMYLIPLISFSLAAYIRFASGLIPLVSTNVDAHYYFGLLILVTITWAIAVEHYQLTSMEVLFASGGKLHRAFLSALITYIVALAITSFYEFTTFSRVFLCLSVINLLLLTLGLQIFFRTIWSGERKKNKALVKLLIIGADELAVRVANSILAGQLMPCEVVGHIRLPGQISAVSNRPVYEMDDIKKLALRNGIDDAIIAIPSSRLAELPSLVASLELLCVPIRAVMDVGAGLAIRQKLFNLGGLLMLDLQPTPADSLPYVVLKRAFDLSFSILVLTLTAPLLALISIAIRCTSPGPIIFVQERVGLNGHVFKMYKFRTMKFEKTEENYTHWTVRNDPRRTKLGAFLRRTSLDELPQFLNVLKGDMSVVGPRPEGPVLVERFMQSIGNYNTRHYLKVGITGWAQVNGWRGDTSIEKRVEHDLYYLRHWTLSFDLLIVLLTLVRGFSDKNAY